MEKLFAFIAQHFGNSVDAVVAAVEEYLSKSDGGLQPEAGVKTEIAGVLVALLTAVYGTAVVSNSDQLRANLKKGMDAWSDSQEKTRSYYAATPEHPAYTTEEQGHGSKTPNERFVAMMGSDIHPLNHDLKNIMEYINPDVMSDIDELNAEAGGRPIWCVTSDKKLLLAVFMASNKPNGPERGTTMLKDKAAQAGFKVEEVVVYPAMFQAHYVFAKLSDYVQK